MDVEQVADGGGAGLLASPGRRAIVEALRTHRTGPGEPEVGGMTAQQLAARLGLHVTTVRFHADRLEAAGVIASHLTTAFGVGRPRKVYALAPTVAAQDRSAYLLHLLEAMTESFTSGATPEEAGEHWARHHLPLVPSPPATSPGTWLAKIGPLVDVLQDWGYAPELTTAGGGRICHIALTECPFLELAVAHPEVVCGIHRGLLLGALSQVGEEDVDVVVEPFVTPTRCRARIMTRQPFDNHHEQPREESLDESRESDAAGPDLGSSLLHQGRGERGPAQPAQKGRTRG
jgi:predicted ArsR family transcriptional regulator